MTTVAKLITHLQTHFHPNDCIAAPIWRVDDVLERAEDLGHNISLPQAETVIHALYTDHDASLGITWETIEYYL